MGFAFKIATRFLRSNKGQTILIAIGISIGVSVQIFIGSLIQGLQKDLVEKTVGSSPHITILPEKNTNGISNYEERIDNALKIEGVKYVASSVDKNVFLKYNDDSYPILMRGIDINEQNDIYKINNRIVEGKKPNNDNQILIGTELQKELNCKVLDKFEIITPEGIKKEFEISGIFDLKVASLNKLWVITNSNSVQQLFDLNDKVTSIEIQVEDVFEADAIAKVFENNDNFKNLVIQNWKVQNQQLLSGLNGQSISSIMIQVFVMISVVLGIASVLAISVSQKSKQIGILKAMGINNKKSSLIFLFQGFLLGVLGAVLGIVLGLGLSWSFTKFAVSSDGTPIIALYIDIGFILISGVIAIIASSIASIIPAINSSKLDPMEVIRNG
jgi:lipoprotein-releasing system permease protein